MLRQNLVYFLTFISILVVPLSSVVPMGQDVWYVQMIFLICFFCIGVSAVAFNFNKFLSIINLVALYSTIVTANQGLRSLMYLFIFNLAILASMAISKFGRDKREKLLKVVLIVFFIQALWVLLQRFNLDPIFDSITDRTIDDIVGFSGSHNQIGLFFAITSPIVFYYLPGFILLSFYAIFLSKTTSALIGAVIGCLIISWYKGIKFFLFFIVFLTVSCAVFFVKYEDATTEVYRERFSLVVHSVKEIVSGKALMKLDGDAFKLVVSRPLEGFGLANFMILSPHTQWQFLDKQVTVQDGGRFFKVWHGPIHRYEHMHNDYAEIFYEMGILGFLGVVALLLNFLWSFIKAKKSAILVVCFSCIMVHLVSAFGIYTIYTAVSGLLLIVFYGIYKGELDGQITSSG